jgi:hypothetical protein
MSLPLKPLTAAEPLIWYAACAALLLLVVSIQVSPAKADARTDPYTVTVKVDATAGNALDARRAARLDGQRRALTKVVQQLAGVPDAKLPTLDDNAITSMVDNFEVANERMSAVRYLADYTFHFRPAQVRRLMQTAGIAFAAAGNGAGASESANDDKPMVLLPVFDDGTAAVLWDDPNPWRDAWAQRPAGAGAARLSVPLGGISDLTVIDAAQAIAGKPDALDAIAARNGGGEAIVALATVQRRGDQLGGFDVTVKRYRQGKLIGTQSETFSVNPGESESDFIKRAVDGTAAAIETGTNEVVANAASAASLTATVPITDLGEWVEVRDRLAAVPAVHKVDLLSLSRREAKIEITYSGTPDQLRSSLAEANLDLGGSDPRWQVRPSDTASPR